MKHKRPTYPHMMPAEVPIWERFLNLHGEYYDAFDYDIHVGKGVGRIPGYSEEQQRQADAVSRKRIDAVGKRGPEVWILEVKPYAGLSAIGQVEGYEILWNLEFPFLRATHKAIVTDRLESDIQTIAEAKGIRVYVV